MTDQSEFKKTIEVGSTDKLHNGSSMNRWVGTLSIEERQEWDQVHRIHECVVNQAISNGDARRVYDDTGSPTHILWKSEDVHLEYIKQMTDHDIYLNFWHRYRETLK